MGPDPFYDLEQHALLGVASFYLECLHHGIKHEYSAPIVAPTGKVCPCFMEMGGVGVLCVMLHSAVVGVWQTESGNRKITK